MVTFVITINKYIFLTRKDMENLGKKKGNPEKTGKVASLIVPPSLENDHPLRDYEFL